MPQGFGQVMSSRMHCGQNPSWWNFLQGSEDWRQLLTAQGTSFGILSCSQHLALRVLLGTSYCLPNACKVLLHSTIGSQIDSSCLPANVSGVSARPACSGSSTAARCQSIGLKQQTGILMVVPDMISGMLSAGTQSMTLPGSSPRLAQRP